MLIEKFRDTYRELSGQTVTAEPVTVYANFRNAANESRIEKAAMQARRFRRQRRMERAGRRNISGWTVRSW